MTVQVRRFTPREVAVEAVRWSGTNEDANTIIKWIQDNGGTARFFEEVNVEDAYKYRPPSPAMIGIDVADYSVQFAKPGHWIVFSSAPVGFSVVGNELFDERYTEVDDGED